MAYKPLIQKTADGEQVNANVANRAPTDLLSNDQYLLDLLNTAMLGQALIIRDQPLDAAVLVGQPVYYRSANTDFAQAIGGFATDEYNAFVLTQTSQAWGVVIHKDSDTCGDILVQGAYWVDLSSALADTYVGDVPPGRYYLSNATAGKLTAVKPPAAVPILYATQTNGEGKTLVYVDASATSGNLDDHRHYRFDLVAYPSGTHVDPAGGRHTITAADNTVEGWLPADDAIFEGNAPTGAVFGYNISANAALAAVWPPQPLEGASLVLNRGKDYQYLGMTVPTGASELCVIDENGIWWLSDCDGDVPWDPELDTATDPGPSSPGATPECPRELHTLLTLWFTRPTFASPTGWVESLEAAANSGLTITNKLSGNPATTGQLVIDSDFADVVLDANSAGFQVVKSVDSEGALLRGPVVEGIQVAGTGVSATASLVDGGVYKGIVTLSVSTQVDGFEVPVDTIYLDGVDQDTTNDFPVLVFRQGRPADIGMRLFIPDNAAIITGTTVKLEFTGVVLAGPNIPASLLSVTFSKIAKPASLETAGDLSVTSTVSASLPTTTVNTPAAGSPQIFRMETAEFAVSPGDIVLVSLARAGDTDGYANDVQIMKSRGVLVTN